MPPLHPPPSDLSLVSQGDKQNTDHQDTTDAFCLPPAPSAPSQPTKVMASRQRVTSDVSSLVKTITQQNPQQPNNDGRSFAEPSSQCSFHHATGDPAIVQSHEVIAIISSDEEVEPLVKDVSAKNHPNLSSHSHPAGPSAPTAATSSTVSTTPLSSNQPVPAPRPFPRQVTWDQVHARYENSTLQAKHNLYLNYIGQSPSKRRKKKQTPSYETTDTESSDEEENDEAPAIVGSARFTVPSASTLTSQISGNVEAHSVSLAFPTDTTSKTYYACQYPAPLICPNQDLVDICLKLEHARDLTGDSMNALAYRKSIAALKNYPVKISKPQQAWALKGIGKKTGRIIADFLRDGRVQDIEMLNANPAYTILERFYSVHGVGNHTAREWLSKDYKTLEDVVAHEKLSADQELGIKYYDDFLKRIPRSEVELLVEEFRAGLQDVQPDCEYTVCGSYRRGKPDSGDVDIVVTHDNAKVTQTLLTKIVDHFKDQGHIVGVLSMSSGPDNSHVTANSVLRNRNCQALCVWLSKHPDAAKIHRRMDIIVAPKMDYPMAVLGWTGSKYFERSIRLYSKTVLGIKMTSHGLFRAGKKLNVESERHAFKILQLNYLEPELRNC
ncbi:Nucleotidyltransferase [Hesseltinella vesiculosa]|uniref:DNA polymerase n=1 Tax=Hesseltinella vesiculosa TaxID=101127 RepID=A0A1X2GV94_9FUNG|nr:Nucleotidyltransferase [Hesseltinella vesiculosa]